MSKEKIIVKCTKMDDEGNGIIKAYGREVKVPAFIEGETAEVELNRKGNYITASIVSIKNKAQSRIKPKCVYYDQCGGCQLQHLSPEGQRDLKQKQVQSLLKEYHGVNPILTMEKPYYYRNKIHAAFTYDRNNKIISGIYEQNSHHVIGMTECIIQDPQADEILATIRELMKSCKIKPYDEDRESGFLRHVLIKTGFASGQIMVVLVTASTIFAAKKPFVSELVKRHPKITTILQNVNDRRTSMVLGGNEKILYGEGFIEDTLCGLTFQISSKSFYQINPVQTERLYGKAMEMAGLTGRETVLDAYCGIGTIGLIAAAQAKSIIGVELNQEAVRDAIRNARRNKIKNAVFHNEDAGEFMTTLAQQKEKIDVVFMDPPRSGSDERFLSSLVHLAPQRIVYISCNPATQARDLQYLTRHQYRVEEIQPVDMFPQTGHIESVVRLERV